MVRLNAKVKVPVSIASFPSIDWIFIWSVSLIAAAEIKAIENVIKLKKKILKKNPETKFLLDFFTTFLLAFFVGFVMGGIQALSRSTYSKFLPETDDTTSYFSFFDVAEKIGIVIGMVIFATIDQVTGSMRNAFLFLFIFFFVGIILLFRVPKNSLTN